MTTNSGAKGTVEELKTFEKKFKYEVPKFKSFLLLVDTAYDICSTSVNGIVSFVLLGVAFAVLFVAAVAFFACKIYRERKSFFTTPKIAMYGAVFFGAAIYFLGDNLVPASMKREPNPCDETCMQRLENVSRFLLFSALICLRIIPSVIVKCIPKKEKKENEEGGELGLQSSTGTTQVQDESQVFQQDTLLSDFGTMALGLLVEVDALYTSIFQDQRMVNTTDLNTTDLNTTDPDETCQGPQITTDYTIYILISAFWTIFIIIYFIAYKKAIELPKPHEKPDQEQAESDKGLPTMYKVINYLIVVAVSIYSFPYLLGDNTYPLECHSKRITIPLRYTMLSIVFLLNLFVTVCTPVLKTIEKGAASKWSWIKAYFRNCFDMQL